MANKIHCKCPGKITNFRFKRNWFLVKKNKKNAYINFLGGSTRRHHHEDSKEGKEEENEDEKEDDDEVN